MGQIDKDTGPRSFPWLTEFDVAHRGLHTAGTAAEENTLPAVAAAIDAGYAIEIDVRATVDGIIVVFHDDTLDRMTNGQGSIKNLGFAQMQKYIVGASGAPAPSLPDVLELVDERRPVFVEIKSSKDTDVQMVCAGVRHCFEGYGGNVAVMSFDPPRHGLVQEVHAAFCARYRRGSGVFAELAQSYGAVYLASSHPS